MAISEAQKKASNKYNKEHMATLGCKVTKEQAQAFKEHCQKKGSTANKVLRDFVFESIGLQSPPHKESENNEWI